MQCIQGVHAVLMEASDDALLNRRPGTQRCDLLPIRPELGHQVVHDDQLRSILVLAVHKQLPAERVARDDPALTVNLSFRSLPLVTQAWR